MAKRGLDEKGHEIMDSKPSRIALGLGEQKCEPLHVMVKRMIRDNANAIAMEQGDETFEEANDFDVDDDYPVETLYERHMDTQVPDEVMQKHIRDLNSKMAELDGKLAQLKEQTHEPTMETISKKAD